MIQQVTDRERALSEQIDAQGGQLAAWRDRAIAAEAELARLRAQEPVGWKHDCAGLCTNDVELWIDACPHCGKPRAAPPAQSEDESLEFVMLQQLCGRMADLLTRTAAALKGPPEPLTLHDWADLPDVAADVAAVARLKPYSDPPLPAQPALSDPVTLADVLDALNVFNKPRPSEGVDPWTEADFISVKHLPDFINIIAVAWFSYAQPAEPVQRLSDAGIEALAGKHGTTYRNRHFPTQPSFSFSNGSLHRFVRDIESAIQPQPGWRDVESAPKESPCA